MDYLLSSVTLPVSDVDAAKTFYVEQAGFRVAQDRQLSGTPRFVQLTPPGSACSVSFGDGLTTMVPGTMEGLQLVVADADAARAEFADRGLEVSEVDERPWGRFVYFADPDGNKWSVQQVVRTDT